MSNPFLIPGSPFTETQRKLRERFKIGVYAALTTTAVFCFAMLIQGCRREVPKGDAAQAGANPVAAVDNTPSAPATIETAAAPPLTQSQAPTVQGATAQPATAAPEPANNLAAQPTPVAATPAPETTASAPAVQTDSAKPEPTPAPAAESTYVVKAGDTLSRIARTHSTTVQAIKAANSLRNDRIVAGKQLKIPAGRKTASSTTQS